MMLNYSKPMNTITSEQLTILQAKYQNHKTNAKRREIAFQLSFDEWCSVWDERVFIPKAKGTVWYAMSRHGDAGPYAIGNVSIKTHVENIKEGNAGERNGNYGGKSRSEKNIKQFNALRATQIGVNHPSALVCNFDGVTYLSVQEAMKGSGLSLYMIRKDKRFMYGS